MSSTMQQDWATGMRIAYAVVDKPVARPVESVRASRQCNNFWFLRSKGSRDLIPMPGATEAQMAVFRPSRDVETTTADSATEIGELAAAIAARLRAEAPAELVRDIDVIIVCTAGFNAPFGVSLAGKVKHILGAAQAFPFMIGQMDGCSAFEALRIARAFIYGPERARVVAIVASECWWYPYIRSFGDYAQYGDGAAAMLVCSGDGSRDEPETGIEVMDIVLDRYEAQQGPFDMQAPSWFRTNTWSHAVGDFLATFLRKHALGAADLASIHSPCLDTAFIDAVARASGLPLTPGMNGFVSSVDPMLAFNTSRNGGPTSGHALSWSVGLNGEMGACLYQWGGHTQASTPEASR